MTETQEARSKLDLIYRDVLGEVGALVQQLAAVSEKVSVCIDDARKLPMDVRLAVAETNRRLNEETMRELANLAARLSNLTHIAEGQAQDVQKRTRRQVFITIGLGAITGGLAGLLVVLASGTLIPGT